MEFAATCIESVYLQSLLSVTVSLVQWSTMSASGTSIHTLHVNSPISVLDILCIREIFVVLLLVEFPFIIMIFRGASRLLTTLAAHVMELDILLKTALRQLSSPDPVNELIVMSTPGLGSSIQQKESNYGVHIIIIRTTTIYFQQLHLSCRFL